jgi:hypothetical protein
LPNSSRSHWQHHHQCSTRSTSTHTSRFRKSDSHFRG